MSDLAKILPHLATRRYIARSLAEVTGDSRLTGVCYEIVLDPPSAPLVFEGVVALAFEDGRQAAYSRIDDGSDKENGTFIVLQSWDDAKQHRELMPFNGRRVRVKVELA